MCRLFAVTSRSPVEINRELSAFFDGSRLHRHGWGWAEIVSGRTRIRRECGPAFESAYASELLSSPLAVTEAFFHIRYATVGAVRLVNAHPLAALDHFGRQWTVIHNGTIFDFDKLDRFFDRQRGSTDTERLLLYLIDRIRALTAGLRTAPDEGRRFSIVADVLKEAAMGNKLNIMISDGEILYVHANSRSGSKALGEAARYDYLYERIFEAAGGACTRLFCTVPLDEEGWTPLPLNTVSAYRRGALLFRAEPHPHEYMETEEDLRFLYSGYAGL